MNRIGLSVVLATTARCFVTTLLACATFAWADNVELFVLDRVVVSAGEGYVPGGTVDVKLTISRTGTSGITAIGLEETLPNGWSFVEIVGGSTPDIIPAVGKEGLLEFAWFPFSDSFPDTPFDFTYRASVPAATSGAQTISGEVLYRVQGVSGEQRSDVNASDVSLARLMLTVNVSPSPSGSVQVNPLPDNDGLYAAGTMVQLTAVESGQFGFYRWHGDVVEDSSNRSLGSVVIDSDEVVTAEFLAKPSLVVLFPNDKEKLKRGKEYTIQWLSLGNAGRKVKIELVRHDEVVTISASTPNDGEFDWTVDARARKKYRIRVSSTSKDESDESDKTFQIKGSD